MGSNLTGASLWSLHVLTVFVWTISGIRLTANSKLPIGVDMRPTGCLSLSVRQIDDHYRASINKNCIKSFPIIITAIIIAPIFIPMSI